MRRVLHVPYQTHRWLLGPLGQQRNIREQLHLKLLRHLTDALNHSSTIVSLLSNIALICARSPMVANMAFMRYHYDVSFKRRLSLNRNAINMHYKLDHVKCSNISVLQELLHCRDSTNAI